LTSDRVNGVNPPVWLAITSGINVRYLVRRVAVVVVIVVGWT
jgi:hypothetical protein